uniref:Uncharacterized protein n=1 Tax=Ditylenchus dipsaci TaxID=166011 RepID=A0A915ELJ1_9BILA
MNSLSLLVVVCMLLGDWMGSGEQHKVQNSLAQLLVRPRPSVVRAGSPTASPQIVEAGAGHHKSNVSDLCKAKGIRLSILITQNDINIIRNLQPPQTVGQAFYEQWAFDRDCGKTAMIVYCNRTKKSSLGLGTQNLPIFKDEFVHVIGMEERILKENKVLLAFLEITNNLEKIAQNRATLLGLRMNRPAKEDATVVFGVLGWAYHRYWMSNLTKRDEKNMTASWKNPPNGTQPVHSHFVSEERVTTGPFKTPIPVVPY